MKDVHNLGVFDTLEKVWDTYPYGGCPGDYSMIGGRVVFWNDERRVWGEFGDDISSDREQIVEGNLTVDKNLTIGGYIKGEDADFKKLVAETLEVKNPPYALKDHKHQLEDIVGSEEGVVVPGTIENAKYAEKANISRDLEENSPVNERFLSKTHSDSTDHLLKLLGGLVSRGGIDTDRVNASELSKLLGGLEVEGGADMDYLRVLETVSAKLVDAVKVSSTDVDATETVSGKNLTAANQVKGNNVVATNLVKGNDIDATETVSGKNVLAAERVAGQTLEAIDTVKGNYIEAKETIKGNHATISGKTTTLNLLVRQLAEMYDLNVSHVATFFRSIVKDYISSDTFIPGFTGEGMKLYKALNGDWNFEVDHLVVRKIMTVFELVISKIRAVNGGLVISPANGKVKSVTFSTGTPAYYVLTIEGDMMFVANDLVRCQVFTGTCIKYYWVPVASVNKDTILILKSDFPAGVIPAEGDDLVQMGNTINKSRQGLLYLTAAEDGKPRISVLDGVNSTSLIGKNKVILGCLNDITDTDFPADFQPSGYGLYAMNVFLKGIFILRNGKTIESELSTTNAAAKAAKDIADAAKSAAGSAQTTANNATTSANGANALLSDIANDNKFTPSEKQATKKEWDTILSEKPLNDASADKFGVAKIIYGTAYTALSTYITPLLTSLITTQDIVGATFRSTFKTYYDARTNLLNAISAKAKTLADTAQEKANAAQKTADDLGTQLTTIETKFEIREGQISAKVTEVTTKATQAATSATNAKTSETNASGAATLSGQKATAAAGSATSAAGSAATAGTKAGEATTSAANAKKAADDAAIVLKDVTLKESSITQTAGQIATKVTEVNTKVAEANTAATNAKKSEAAASGSATTAGSKAGEAAASANNAKGSADSAAAKLLTITEKESSITQTAGQIATKVTEVTKKATEAATSATNAKTSETNAGTKATQASGSATAAAGSATTAGTKAADAKKAADDAAAKLVTITQKESSINQTAGSITLQVTEVTTKASQAATSASAAENSAEIAKAMSNGKILYRDPTFESGLNGSFPYLVGTRVVEAITGCPNRLAKGMKITATGWNSASDLRISGFCFATLSRANAIFVVRIIALIPIGRTIQNYHNVYGTGGTAKWLTSQAGTGKWEEYACKVTCGSTGKFSSINHFALTGGVAPTTTAPVIWYVAYATVFDTTDAEVDYIADAAGKYTTKTEHSSSINQLSDKIELKVAKTDFNALGNRVSSAETIITQHTGQISLKAEKTDVTALGSRMASAEQKITPDAIKSTVKSQTDSIAASAASNAVNGLQVGGRNYFQKTTSINVLSGNPTIDRNQSECVNGVYLIGDKTNTSSVRISKVITCNGYWTISFEIRGSQSVAVGFNVDFCDLTSFVARSTANNTWSKCSFTCNVTNASSVYHFVDLQSISWAHVNIRNIKIEQGNKETDWTPAPEDVTSDAQVKADAAQAAAESVAIAKAALAKSEASAYADGIVTAEERRAIADANAKLEAAKADAQTKANAAKQAAINDAATKYPTKSEHSSDITQLSNKIELKVSKTDFDALGRRVGSAETTITQHTNQISLKAAQSDVTALGNRVSSAEAKITPDAINLTVKSQTDSIAASAASNAVNGLQIGGRNLLLKSKVSKSNTSYNVGYWDATRDFVVGEEFTVTIKGNIPGTKLFTMWFNTDRLGGWAIPKVENGLYSLSQKVPGGTNTRRVGVYLHENTANTDAWSFEWIKLETGNRRTDWTPAPEDVTSDAQVKADAAQAAAESVAIAKAALAKSEASAYADGIVTAEERRAIADANAKLEAAKADAQTKANAAKQAAINDAATKYPTKSEHSSDITQLSNKIELKVSKTDFDTLGRRVGSAETTITQHTNQISLKAAQSDVTALGNRVSSAEAKITPDAINLTVKSQTNAIAAAAARRTTVLIDTTGLDTTKYYPITISLSPTNPYTITVQRSLDGSMGKPSWSSHVGGFSVLCSWTSNGCVWGTIPVQRAIHTYAFAHSTVTPVGSIGQLTNSSLEYVYVRGGSKYYVVVDGSSSAEIVLRTSAYTQSDQTVGILTSVTVPIPDIKMVSAAAADAQDTANNAVTSANGANALLSDIASDNKLTAMEKQATKKEWDIIVSEKSKNDASADKFGVSKAAYGTAYTTLSSYIIPVLASLTTTSAITGTDFRAKFKAYYDARTDLLNAISSAAKMLADTAQKTANDLGTQLSEVEAKFEIREGQISSKVTQTTTSATNAKTSETNAAGSASTATSKATAASNSASAASGSATTAGQKATAAAGSAADAAAKLAIITTKETSINQTAKEITIQASTVTTKTAEAINAAELAVAMSKGKMMYRDPTFESGLNGSSPYLVGTRVVEAITGCPNRLAKGMKITATGWNSASDLRISGFCFATLSRANAIFVVRIIALIPIGRTIQNYHNVYGTGGTTKWLTSQAGTGKWEEYACKVTCGSTGKFSSINHFALTGGVAPTTTAPVIWYVAYATVFDTTDVDDVPTVDEIKSGMTVSAGKISIFGKDISLAGVVSFSSLASDAQGKITAAQSTADAAKSAAGSAQTTANNATASANTANTLLSDIASDSKLTATEKQQTKKEWDAIVSEKVKNDASADKFSVSKAAYGMAYTALSTYITPLLASLTTTSVITGTDFRAKFKAYYDARTDLLNDISAKAKTLADAAQGAASTVNTSLNTLKKSLGTLAYESMVTVAKLDSTIIEGGFIKTNLIDVQKMITSELLAEKIQATDITTSRLTVNNGSKLGAWTIEKDAIVSRDISNAKILLDSSINQFLHVNNYGKVDNSSGSGFPFLEIRNDGMDCLSLSTYGVKGTALNIISNTNDYAINSSGGHIFYQRRGETWNAPGVLWAGFFNCNNWYPSLERSWGDGCSVWYVSKDKNGVYTFGHNLTHTDYYVMAMPSSQIRTDYNWWTMSCSFIQFSSTSFKIQFRVTDGTEVDPAQFQLIVFGRNVKC